MEKHNLILQLLPGFNCGICGFQSCESFASALMEGQVQLNKCRVLEQNRFSENRSKLEQLIFSGMQDEMNRFIGLIDHCKADFCLNPLPGEISCRETLVSFSPLKLEKDMLIRYRPLGCPITHFARVISVDHGLADVWVTGPDRQENTNKEIIFMGVCMILSFQGIIMGKLPDVGQTVKFLPTHCMMGKVHSGVVVQLEDNRARIDCIDLKIWEHAR